MLQISAGRFFRPGVPINERIHRRTVYSNGLFLDPTPVELPVGTIISSTGIHELSTAILEAVDRLEARTPDGTDEFMVATGGDELIDDITYVMTFALNRTFSRNHGQVRRLVSREGVTRRRGGAPSLFPDLFDPQQAIHTAELEHLKQFMGDLLALARDDFVRIMRVIRNSVDATRRAIDDPTGAYTDLVAALESLSDDHLAAPVSWESYDGRKRKIIDDALKGEDRSLVEKMQTAVLEADRAGLKRRFVSSTLGRISEAYYRSEAVGTVSPPKSAELERMLDIAYRIRSSRTHILEDLGDEAWVFTDGAETVFEPRSRRRILTLAGVWRLVRHVARQFVADAPKPEPDYWDYRNALPGIIQAQLAPQYWVCQPNRFNAKTAAMWFNGVVEALIDWYSGRTDERINLEQVIEKIEQLVPNMPDNDAKTAMVAIYALWHESTSSEEDSSSAKEFLDRHGACLDTPSPIAFTAGLLSDRRHAVWTVDEWAELATARRAARSNGTETPLPAAVDTLLQLETADRLEAAGRHDEAVRCAKQAVEECPGHENLLDWEKRLISGDHDPNFSCHSFLFGKGAAAEQAGREPTTQPEEAPAATESRDEHDRNS